MARSSSRRQRKNHMGKGRRRLHPSFLTRPSNLFVEDLEARQLLAADDLVLNLTPTIVGNLKKANDTILGAINATGTNNAFNTPIPGVLMTYHDVNGDGNL